MAEHSFSVGSSLSVMMPMQGARDKHGADTALILFPCDCEMDLVLFSLGNVKKFIRSVCTKMSRHGGSSILRVFHLPTRTQLNAAHAQLIENLRLEIFYGKFADF